MTNQMSDTPAPAADPSLYDSGLCCRTWHLQHPTDARRRLCPCPCHLRPPKPVEDVAATHLRNARARMYEVSDTSPLYQAIEHILDYLEDMHNGRPR